MEQRELRKGILRAQKRKIKKQLHLFFKPVFLVFVLFTAVIMTAEYGWVFQNTKQKLENQTNAIVEQTWNYFVNYEKVAEQANGNLTLLRYLKDTDGREEMMTSVYYEDALEQIKNITRQNQSDLLMSWLVDLEDNYIFESGGWHGDADWDMRKRDWYQSLITCDQVMISDPYVSVSDQQRQVSVISQIRDQGKLIGAFAVDLNIHRLPKILAAHKVGKKGYATLIASDGEIISHENETLVYTDFAKAGYSKKICEAVSAGKAGFYLYQFEGMTYLGSLQELGDSGWLVLTQQPYAELWKETILHMAVILAALCVAVVIVWAIIKRQIAKL